MIKITLLHVGFQLLGAKLRDLHRRSDPGTRWRLPTRPNSHFASPLLNFWRRHCKELRIKPWTVQTEQILVSQVLAQEQLFRTFIAKIKCVKVRWKCVYYQFETMFCGVIASWKLECKCGCCELNTDTLSCLGCYESF